MTVYVLLFRGVGGATQLPTAPLRAALTDAGFENAATYINSGNAVVRSRWGVERVTATVAELCAEKFDFTKAIYAVALPDWDQLIASNPFPDETVPGNLLHAAWLEREPAEANIAALQELAVNGELFAVVGNAAYLHTPNGFSKSKLGERFDKGIGVPNTARNWNTVLKLQALGRAAL